MPPEPPNPYWDEDLFDAILLAGQRSPGTVKISGHDRKISWDVKEGSGQSGATTTLKSVPPIEFTVVFYLADEDEFALWPAYRTLINSTISGPKPKALDIYHPDLAANGITSVVLALMGGVVHDGKGGQTITVKFQEYKPPKPKTGSPSGSKAKAAATDPNAARLAYLRQLTDEYNRTPWDGTKAKPRDLGLLR